MTSTGLAGAVRGGVAAMAMSGLRQATASAGLIGPTPPEQVLGERAPGILGRVPPARRPLIVELAHWLYGAGGGAAFGLLPPGVRRQVWAGPCFGLLVWAVFEVGVAPALGLSHAKQTPTRDRLAFLADHLLYGAVVGHETRQPSR